MSKTQVLPAYIQHLMASSAYVKSFRTTNFFFEISKTFAVININALEATASGC